MKDKTTRPGMFERKGPSVFTLAYNTKMAQSLPFGDTRSFDDAKQGQLVATPDLNITAGETTVWTLAPYTDQTEGSTAPDTVNPSLWRQATANTFSGLFRVCETIYQVRTFDMSNMTIIEAPDGLILIDPLISIECASAALKLYQDYVKGKNGSVKDVAAVIYTHSHVDHFGGVAGVVEEKDVGTKVRIYAPDGFLEHAVSENVYAGCAMARRAQYMYGSSPDMVSDHKGHVDTGLGKGQSTGNVSLFKPTDTIAAKDGSRLVKNTIAGLDVWFHLTPGSEAPAEMDFYFPHVHAFCAAENVTHNMHNLQTLRGANVRDALAWSKYLGEALEHFGHVATVMFASHHWPIWGNDNIVDFISRQRDMYRYLNDQTLRMLNRGYTGIELAEVFKMPDGIDQNWSCRGYYGSVSHNTKAVYDKYLGWFDGDPSNLHRLTPQDAAPKYVKLMGGAAAVIKAAQDALDTGDYRWASELLRHVVFADPNNEIARGLQADALEQMGYQAENATWRNFFLTGALELRNGAPDNSNGTPTSPTMIEAMTLDMIFDSLGARLIGPVAAHYDLTMSWKFTDTEEYYVVSVRNGALSYVSFAQTPETATAQGTAKLPGSAEGNGHFAPGPVKPTIPADVTITTTRATLNQLLAAETSLQACLSNQSITTTGDTKKLLVFLCLLDDMDPSFPIVTPRSDAQAAWSGEDHLIALNKLDEAALMKHPKISSTVRFFGPIPHGC